MLRCLLLGIWVVLGVGCGGPRADAVTDEPLFTDEERRAVAAYWSGPARYVVEPSPDVWPTWQGQTWIKAAQRRLGGARRQQLAAWLGRRQAYEAWVLGNKQGGAPPAPGPLPEDCPVPPTSVNAGSRVNITVGGSTWHHGYAALVAERRGTVSGQPPALPEIADWETWMARRITWDKSGVDGGPACPPPGPMPASLKQALGEPPPLFVRVRPTRYTVTFAPEDAPAPFVYTDTIPFGDRYAYYRSSNGVVRYGQPIKNYGGADKARIDQLFARAGRDTFERNVLQAVSRFEGGFEAVNTYDTGFLSVGFIQFITARNGDGSLAAVLQRHKTDNPDDFQATFRRFGVDVTVDGLIAVLDPATGNELRGASAVQKIIDDKRLTAVFERAGHTDGFRLAQVLIARSRYWPGDDPVTVPLATVYEQPDAQSMPVVSGVFYGATAPAAQETAAAARQVERQTSNPAYRSWVETRILSARVSDLVRSEAGMATLMDRKVHRGNIRAINEVAATLMREHKLANIEDLARHERALVAAMKHRGDFLSDSILGQPKETAGHAFPVRR